MRLKNDPTMYLIITTLLMFQSIKPSTSKPLLPTDENVSENHQGVLMVTKELHLDMDPKQSGYFEYDERTLSSNRTYTELVKYETTPTPTEMTEEKYDDEDLGEDDDDDNGNVESEDTKSNTTKSFSNTPEVIPQLVIESVDVSWNTALQATEPTETTYIETSTMSDDQYDKDDQPIKPSTTMSSDTTPEDTEPTETTTNIETSTIPENELDEDRLPSSNCVTRANILTLLVSISLFYM